MLCNLYMRTLRHLVGVFAGSPRHLLARVAEEGSVELWLGGEEDVLDAVEHKRGAVRRMRWAQ